MKKLLVLLIVAAFAAVAMAQCSSYCSTCNCGGGGCGGGTWGTPGIVQTCSGCPTYFNSTGNGNPCFVDTTRYLLEMELANGDFSLNNSLTSACGAITSSSPGIFNPTDIVEIYTTTAMPTHYLLRVRGMALFVDRWNSGDRVFIQVNAVTKASRSYGTSAQIGSTNSCGPDNQKERYGTLDSNQYSHNALATTITASSDWCDCTGTNLATCKPCGWMLPEIIVMVVLCNETCLTCYGPSNTQCYNCTNATDGTQYLLTNRTCDITCAYLYYQSAPNLCARCNTNCTVCEVTATNCSACATGHVLFPPNATCPTSCPTFYYFDATTNQCQLCDASCQLCTDNPSPCQYCASGFYMWNTVCYNPCPDPTLLLNDVNRTCENCTIWCVGLTMSFYQPTGMNGLSPLYVDMKFNQPLDTATFPLETFQTISFANPLYNINQFNVKYTWLSSMTYRITMIPMGFALIVNETVIVTTMAMPSPKHNAADGRPFKDENYGISASLIWSYVKPPDMTDLEQSIVSGFSSFSSTVNSALQKPGLQEIKKLGFMLLMMNSLQITSCLILLNLIMPQNLYEGIRVFASMIFFDVPPWEAESTANKLFVVPPVDTMARRRILQQTGNVKLGEFRFRRTGFTNIFIFDCYTQILLIVVCYLVLLGCICLSKRSKKFDQALPFLYSILTALHQISLMYFTLTIMFEFVYFDTTKAVRFASAIIALLVALYYLIYQVYRYHDIMEFPLLDPQSQRFNEIVMKYGSILKNIRFEEFDYKKGCIPIKAYFRPHSYHIVSYVKKLLMMLTFPLFYVSGNTALCVLMVVQALEIARFCLTWPFAKRWRNILRLCLDVVLLLIFIVVFAIQIISVLIFGTAATAENVKMYFLLGWIGFVFIMIFNFTYFIICCIDLYYSYKFTNREMIDMNRRDYYYEKLNQIESKDKDVPVEIMAEYVKKGNLNNRKLNKLPDVDFRIELYVISRGERGDYEVNINNVMEAEMTTEFNYKEAENNVSVTRKFEGNWNITPQHGQVYRIIDGCFQRYARRDTSSIIIKTFSKIEQRKYQCNQRIDLYLNRMKQEVEIENIQKEQNEVIVLEELIPGFPIPEGLLLQVDKRASGPKLESLMEEMLLASQNVSRSRAADSRYP